MRKRIMSIELAHEMPDGGWRYAVLELPAKDHEIRDALQRARITEHEEDHWDLSVLRCEIWPDLLHSRLDEPTLDELNFFARRLAGMDAVQCTVFRAVAPGVLGSPEDELISMKDKMY